MLLAIQQLKLSKSMCKPLQPELEPIGDVWANTDNDNRSESDDSSVGLNKAYTLYGRSGGRQGDLCDHCQVTFGR